MDAETPDPSWQTLIESGGHTYTLFETATSNLTPSDQASKDYVNGFDILIISGSNPLFNAARYNADEMGASGTSAGSVLYIR